MVQRTHKKVVEQAIKYSAEKWQLPALQRLSWDERDRLAFDICEALDRYNSKEIKDEQKAIAAIRTEGGLMLTRSARGGDYWATARGTPINVATARFLIERKFVNPTGSGLLPDSEPQHYEPTIS